MEFVQQVAGLFLILVLNLRKTHTIFSWRTNLKEKIPADLEKIFTNLLKQFRRQHSPSFQFLPFPKLTFQFSNTNQAVHDSQQ